MFVRAETVDMTVISHCSEVLQQLRHPALLN